MKRNINNSNRGFSLLEMTVVIIIITILTTAATPVLTREYLNKAVDKVSLDINAIEDGALAYYVRNNSWPTSITPTGLTPATDLESNGFLPIGWNAINPFGYLYTASTSGSLFTVSTQVINGSQIGIINQLPASSYSGTTVTSSVPLPGESSSGFGFWDNESANTIYHAATDGFVVAISTNWNQAVVFSILSDSNPTPTTIRYAFGQNNFNQNYVAGTGVVPVRSGDYWEVQYNNSEGGNQSVTVYWLPR